MTSIDFFYWSLGAGFLILIGCLVAVTAQVFLVLKDVRVVTRDLSGLAGDVAALKDGIKVVILKAIQSFLEKRGKGGDNENHK